MSTKGTIWNQGPPEAIEIGEIVDLKYSPSTESNARVIKVESRIQIRVKSRNTGKEWVMTTSEYRIWRRGRASGIERNAYITVEELKP